MRVALNHYAILSRQVKGADRQLSAQFAKTQESMNYILRKEYAPNVLVIVNIVA